MRARDVLGAALLLVGCAAAPHDGEAPIAPPAPLDAPVSQATQAPAGEADRVVIDDDGFAEYERLLADKETRLRAAGVLLARREDLKEAKPATDPRYAPPPPSPTGGDALAAEKGKAGGGYGRATEAAKPRPTTAPSAATVPADPARKRVSKDKAERAPRPAPAKNQESAAAASEDEGGVGRCALICDLADTTCDLEGKICDLAARHPGDARYTDLCRRAEDDCKLAADACQQCSP